MGRLKADFCCWQTLIHQLYRTLESFKILKEFSSIKVMFLLKGQ